MTLPDKNKYFNLAHIEPTTHIYGPGPRYTLWLQGCNLACRGCWNKQMWSHKPHTLLHRKTLLEQILETKNINGITLLGGEPLQQANNTLWLIEQIRQHSQLNILVYTGYEPNEIKEQGVWDRLTDYADLIISGRYEQSLRNINQQWRGSENQQLIYPTNSRLTAQDNNLNEIEIIISEQGAVTTLGYPH